MLQAPRSLVRALLYPLHECLRGRSTLRHAQAMKAHDSLDPEALRRLHDGLLVAHLRYAAQTVPWYRERIDAGSISSPEDLSQFPVLDKESVRGAGDQPRSESWSGKLVSLETGGSSGQPLRFWSDQDPESSQLACELRSLLGQGM